MHKRATSFSATGVATSIAKGVAKDLARGLAATGLAATGLAAMVAMPATALAAERGEARGAVVERTVPTMSPQQIAAGVEQVAGELQRMEQRFASIPDLSTTKDGDQADRANTGVLFYAMKDYPRASLMLFSVVDPKGSEQQAWYSDAVFALAESLYQTGNLVPARTYFHRVLKVPGHPDKDIAIQRLIEIAGTTGDLESIDTYYRDYLGVVGENVPGDVRYLRGKVLLLGGRDQDAVAELQQIKEGTPYHLRGRYLVGAALVKTGKLEEALEVFASVGAARPVAKQDRSVKELAHIARGRILYELDRLDESIDAYQEVPYDSENLTTMLYEVTWTYVRRGQLQLRNDDPKLTEEDKARRAKVEYAKALDQLDDLRALESDTDRAADIDLLAANLRLQTKEFDGAEQTFAHVLELYRDADQELRDLLADRAQHGRLLEDILAMGSGGLAVDSILPPIAARRAQSNPEVAKSLGVFRELQQSRREIEASDKMLRELLAALSPENPSRAELFAPLRSGLKSSLTATNTLMSLRAQVETAERKLARIPPSEQAKLADVRRRREELEAKVAALPKDADAMTERQRRFEQGFQKQDQIIHQVDLEIARLRANLAAIDTMIAQPKVRNSLSPTSGELLRNEVRALKKRIEDHVATSEALREALSTAKRQLALAGGGTEGERALRAQLLAVYEEERALLSTMRDPAQAAVYQQLDGARARIDELNARNQSFRARLDAAVDRHVTAILAALREEQEHLVQYASSMSILDADAAGLRENATALALERVREDLNGIVTRADVGLIDVAFGRKQHDTETIGKLQRAKAAELTDLNQAYADLQKDEVQ